MAKSKNPYHNFETFCLRIPLLPLDTYFNLTNKQEISIPQLVQLYDDPVIKEALYLASPELVEVLEKSGMAAMSTSKGEKLLFSFLKYVSRMTARCTPFGLFAGCGSGIFSDQNMIRPKERLQYRRQTRYDMHYLVTLGQELAKEKQIREQLLWYPNSSLYAAGSHYRYVEYTYVNKRRLRSIEAVGRSEYLEQLLAFAKAGKTIQELAITLVDDDITSTDAMDFVEELIDNQLLVSEIEPTVTGEDYLEQLLDVVARLKGAEVIQHKIKQLQEGLQTLDQKTGNSPDDYTALRTLLENGGKTVDPKYLFQTDLFLETEDARLDRNWVHTIKKGITLLNKMTPSYKVNSHLEQFKKAFQERYEDRAVSLATALDIEMGIGYVRGQNASGTDSLLDDLVLPGPPPSSEQQLSWNAITEILHQKLQGVIRNSEQQLILTDADFATQNALWEDLPDTIASMVEFIKIGGESHVVFDSAGGSSAGNLLGRFCYGDPELHELVNGITAKESELKPNAIHAEIVHLPESRTGNILRRPVLRNYEIPYLGGASVPKAQQVPLEDLTLSMHRGRLVLRSKKHQKEVIPHLTNAHNYSANALPIYHLLCDLQTQGIRSGVGFSWGALAAQNSFLPRVVYQNIIFAKARWTFEKQEWEPFQKVKNDPQELVALIQAWRQKHQLPQYVQWVEGDNTLLINLENATTVQMLLHSCKNRSKVLLEEFLFNKDAIVQNELGAYTNQVVVAFYKQQLQKSNAHG